ncbi:MAG: DUF362 domain-containing protein [bacterium]
MYINPDKCIGCQVCLPYCNVGAISMVGKKAVIDNKVCVECWVCYRKNVCPRGAFEKITLESFQDVFKHVISDPTETTAETGVPGRGTEESKTNDVTGRFKKGEVGIAIDMGRPGVGCYMYDVEKVAMAVARAGVKLVGPEHTPLAKVMTDLSTGKLQDNILDLHVLSVIIEGTCSYEHFPAVLEAIKKVEKEIDTVFSLGIISRVDEAGDAPVLKYLQGYGFQRPVRGKVNVGLGRPLCQD